MPKPEKYRCLAIDMGASNIRVILGEVTGDSLVHTEICRFTNQVINQEGHERWDMELIFRELLPGITRAAGEAGYIASLGVDSWGVDFVLLDAGGSLLENPVAYRDSRTEGMEKKWLERMDREETFRRTGINFYVFNTLFQLLSMQEGHEIQKASRLLMLPSYVLYEFCGQMRNELTIASTSQMLNAGSGEWDPEILRSLGIPLSRMAPLCAPGTVLGPVRHAELDLPDARAIAVCQHDTASAVVAVPFEEAESVFISTGTWCIVGIESARPVLTPEALAGGFTNERGYGGSFRFLKNIVGLWLVQGLMKSLRVGGDFSRVESLASEYDGEIPVINPEDPLFYNPEDMRKAFDEYFLKTGQEVPSQPGGYFRCAYDSLVYSFRSHIEKIERMTGKPVRTIHLIGGGCQSAYLSRQTAIICRRRVISGPVEAAATGNILVQAIAGGALAGLEEARKLIRRTQSVRSLDPGDVQKDREAFYRKYLALAGEQAR